MVIVPSAVRKENNFFVNLIANKTHLYYQKERRITDVNYFFVRLIANKKHLYLIPNHFECWKEGY